MGKLRVACATWIIPLTIGLLPMTVTAQADQRARQILELTNRDRTEQGLKPLQWNDALAAAAAAHAARMREEQSLSHQYSGEADVATRAAQSGAHFQAIAENIAMGPDAAAIEQQWMKSVPHRTNILDPEMNAIGIAVVERGGYLYAVEDFANAQELLTVEQVEQKVSDLLRNEKIDPTGPRDVGRQACFMNGGLPQNAPGTGQARAVVTFETPNLKQLPAEVARQLQSGQFTKAAVGACQTGRQQSNFATYRVAVLFY